MIFIENPILFYKQLESLAHSIYSFLSKGSADTTALVVPTCDDFIVNDKSMPFSRTFALKKADGRVNADALDEGAEILKYKNLCHGSFDEKNWIDLDFIKKDKNFAQIMDLDECPDEFEFYLKDITSSFFTRITNKTVAVFYMYLDKNIIDEEDKCYLNTPQTFVFIEDREELSKNMGELNLLQISISDEKEEHKLTSVKGEDFFNFNIITTKDFDLFEKRLEDKREVYSLVSEKKTILVDGKRRKRAEYNPMLASVVCAFEEILNKDNRNFDKKIQGVFRKYNDCIRRIERGTACDFNGAVAKSVLSATEKAMAYFQNISYASKDMPELAVLLEELRAGIDDIIDKADDAIADSMLCIRYFRDYCKIADLADEKQTKKQESVEKFNSKIDEMSLFPGSVKGAIASAIFNAVAKKVYESYKEYTIEDDLYNADEVSKEFMQTEESKNFVRELIEIDICSSFLLILNVLGSDEFQQNKYYEWATEKLPDTNKLYDDFCIAAKLYAKVLAKSLRIGFVPEYEDSVEQLMTRFEDEYCTTEDDYCNQKPLEKQRFMLLKIIGIFPYAPKFYEKYFELGGRLTDELYDYACESMVDLREQHKQEQARIKKEKTAAKRREKEEAKRKAEEEKRKAEEAERKRAEEERQRAEEEKRKAEEAERKRAEEERQRAEEEKRKAEEAERKRIDAEKRKAAAEKRKAEEAERMRAEEERQRAEEEKRKEEEAERRRIDAEKRKAAAEKRKAEEEKKRIQEEIQHRQEKEFLAEKYLELQEKYPKLFESMENNPYYLYSRDMEVNSFRDVSRAVFGYIKKNYPDMYLTLYSGESGKFTSKLAALKMSHGGYVTENNVVLFFDNSLFGGLKENYVITTDTICVRNPFEKQMYFSIKDVKQVTFDQKNIYINDWFRVDIGVCRLGNPELANMFVFCICSLLLLQEKAHYTYFSTQEMSKDELSADSNIRKCSCGNVISASDAFCSRCGKPNNGESQEWICGHCNEKNPKVARFCGSCGTPKE